MGNKTVNRLSLKLNMSMIVAVFISGFIFVTINFTNQLSYSNFINVSSKAFLEDTLEGTKDISLNIGIRDYEDLLSVVEVVLIDLEKNSNSLNKKLSYDMLSLLVTFKGILGVEYINIRNNMLALYKNEDGEIVSGSVLENIDNHESVQVLDKEIKENDIKYGKIKIYLDSGKFLEVSEHTGDIVLEDFDFLVASLEEETNKALFYKRVSAAIYGMIIITTIYLIIQFLINKPIRKIRHSLEVFFIAFRTKNKSMEKIEIDTKDEFGDMANMLNDNMDDILSLHSVLQETQRKLQDSITYASTIQSNIIARKNPIDEFFIDHFIYWKPRDIVGGDIYFCDTLSEDECLLICIDCTGHGVSGAFITILTKSIHHNIMTDIENNTISYKEKISPSYIMAYFNKTIKKILKQQDQNSKTNVGFDGGIIYVNKKTKEVKYTGANNSLLIINDKGKSEVLKGDDYSVGYNTCDKNYKYQEHTINIKGNTKLYLSTDGYVDQMGGDKGFRFGMKRFQNMIDDNHNEVFEKQKSIYVDTLNKYAGYKEIIDDITFIGVSLMDNETSKKIVLEYSGAFTQEKIVSLIKSLEKELSFIDTHISTSKKISISFIELTQNILKYSQKNNFNTSKYTESIEVYKKDNSYHIISSNVISVKNKNTIDKKMKYIQSKGISYIKENYMSLCMEEDNRHKDGAGIGFFQLAFKGDSIEYKITKIDDSNYYFIFTVSINENSTKGK